jgi:UDP-sulfoquinovose synthase
VIDLAEIISRLTGAEIDLVPNPRKEASANDLLVANDHLLKLGLDPITLEEELMTEVTEIAERYAHRCDRDKIPARSLWRRQKQSGGVTEPAPA